MAYGPAGEIYIVRYYNIGDLIRLFISTDNGQTFSSLQVSHEVTGGNGYPDICVDSTGSVFIVWCTHVGADFNLWLNKWTSGGGLEAPELIDTTAGGAPRGFLHPKIDTDSQGNVHVAYYLVPGVAPPHLYYRSRTAAGVWGAITQLDALGMSSDGPRVLRVGAGDTVHVCWGLNGTAQYHTTWDGAAWSTQSYPNSSGLTGCVDAAGVFHTVATDITGGTFNGFNVDGKYIIPIVSSSGASLTVDREGKLYVITQETETDPLTGAWTYNLYVARLPRETTLTKQAWRDGYRVPLVDLVNSLTPPTNIRDSGFNALVDLTEISGVNDTAGLWQLTPDAGLPNNRLITRAGRQR